MADVGAGLGYFTPRLARLVGARGRVLAVDLQQQMLDRIAALKLENVRLVLGGESDPHLAPQAVDLVLLANSYHEFAQPAVMLAALKRSLKPGGAWWWSSMRSKTQASPSRPCIA